MINSGGPFCIGTNTSTCPGGPTTLPIPTFLQFAAHPLLVFELQGIAAGSATNCLTNATVTCSIAGISTRAYSDRNIRHEFIHWIIRSCE
jgi:hypothetical protein